MGTDLNTAFNTAFNTACGYCTTHYRRLFMSVQQILQHRLQSSHRLQSNSWQLSCMCHSIGFLTHAAHGTMVAMLAHHVLTRLMRYEHAQTPLWLLWACAFLSQKGPQTESKRKSPVKGQKVTHQIASEPSHWRNDAQGTFIKPARPCLSTGAQPAAFALRARSSASSSELRSLSILEKTDGCTNYRTDPVQV